jgi:Protein of unknown function (DUF2735)
MDTNSSDAASGSAKIYQFPARGRFLMRETELREREGTAPSFASPGVTTIVFGSGWYHEEAIAEERAR